MPGQPITQQDQRDEYDLDDQFGRTWHVTVEKITGDSTGATNRVGGWDDPLRTPQQFIRMRKGARRNAVLSVEIAMQEWIEQQQREEEIWVRRMQEVAIGLYKKFNPEDVPHLENDAMVRAATGRKPWPSSVVLEAAMAGDRQYLGLEKLDTEHRKALGLPVLLSRDVIAKADVSVPHPVAETISPPPDNYPDFVQWAFKTQGVRSLTEVGKMWQDHRTRMKEAVS